MGYQPARVDKPTKVAVYSCGQTKHENKQNKKKMPALNASTTAVFNSIGLTASDIYDVFVSLIGTAVSFGLWLIQVSWPFLLGIAFIYLMWQLAHKFTGFGR